MTSELLRLRLDLGPVKIAPNPDDPGSPLINVAGIVALAAQGDTPSARRFYGGFVKVWARWRHMPGSDNEKQRGALDEALAAIGSTLVPRPAQMS